MSSVFGKFVCSSRHDIVLDNMTVRLRPLAGYVPSPRKLGLGGQHTSYLPTLRAYSTVPTLGRTVCQIPVIRIDKLLHNFTS